MEKFHTHDYSKFKRFGNNLNREIKESAVKDLMISFSNSFSDKEPFVRVTPKMEIIDGQHRFEAAKRLNLPIVYEIDKDFKIEHLMLYQVQRPWSPTDYVNHYAARGNECYGFLRDMSEKYKLSLTSVTTLLTGSVFNKNAMRAGELTFDIREKVKLEGIVDKASTVIYTLKDETNLRPTKFYKCSTFCKAIRTFLLDEDIDFDRFMNKIRLHWTDITPQQDSEDYIRIFLQIYNKYQRKK